VTEDQIQQKLVELLENFCRPDVTWFAVPNGGWRSKKTATRLKATGVRPGVPDIIVLARGHMHGIELKREAGRTTKTQDAFGAEIERAGGGYHVCRGFREALLCLIELNVFLPRIKFTISGDIIDAKPKPDALPALRKSDRRSACRRAPAAAQGNDL
jgi:hypothetical protein